MEKVDLFCANESLWVFNPKSWALGAQMGSTVLSGRGERKVFGKQWPPHRRWAEFSHFAEFFLKFPFSNTLQAFDTLCQMQRDDRKKKEKHFFRLCSCLQFSNLIFQCVNISRCVLVNDSLDIDGTDSDKRITQNHFWNFMLTKPCFSSVLPSLQTSRCSMFHLMICFGRLHIINSALWLSDVDHSHVWRTYVCYHCSLGVAP